jgi:hypothetical protein
MSVIILISYAIGAVLLTVLSSDPAVQIAFGVAAFTLFAMAHATMMGKVRR